MKIGIGSEAYFSLNSKPEDFKKIKSHGYDCIDYQNFINTETELFKISDKQFEEQLKKEASYAKDAGLEIFQAHAPWRYPPQDDTKENRAERFEKMKKTIFGTAVLGCKYFVIHPIMPFGPDKEPDTEKFHELNYEFMNSLIPIAKENGVVICLENMPMTSLSVSKPSETLAFVKNINSEYMKVCIDTGHCAVFGISPAEAIRMTGEYLKVLHVHDNNGRQDWHWLPYHGVIDWEDFNKALHDIEYKGCVSIETQASKNLPCELKEYFQIGLAKIAKKLAE